MIDHIKQSKIMEKPWSENEAHSSYLNFNFIKTRLIFYRLRRKRDYYSR